MPHLVILYTPNIEAETDMRVLCRALADTLIAQHDEAGKQVFPTGGTRVLAYPAAHHAVADGSGDHAFVYLQLRMAAGRPAPLQQQVGQALQACVDAHLAPLVARRPIGITLQIDEGLPVFDGKLGNLHGLFNR